MEEVAFLEMFPFCEPLQVSYGSLEGVAVQEATVNRA